MKQTIRNFRRRLGIQLLAIFFLYFLITAGCDLFTGNSLTDAVSNYTIRDSSIQSAEDLTYRLIGDSSSIEVEKLWVEDGKIYYTLKSLNAGEVFLLIGKAGSETNLTAELFKVSGSGRITCVYTGNYSNCRFHILINVIFLTSFAGLCLVNLLRAHRKLRYTYDLMFIGGLLIWFICTVIIQWYACLHFEYVFAYYTDLQNSAYWFMLYTAPVVWIFCIALSVSNVSLIRHEGYRPVNALGILISVLLIFGSLIGVLTRNIAYGTTPEQIRLVNIAVSTYCSVYALFACLLEGAVIGGISAAKHIPSMDCDYVIILGCTIRKDGSLTPLLRGRADRAIAHAKAQEQATGKKLIFVPSGGHGKNEVMAEGEAIRQYLLSQGIPEEQILVESKSKNTAENMLFSKALIEAQKPDAKIAFSTTNYHVFRSGIIAGQKDFAPEGMGSKTKWYFWPNAFIREFLGMIVYTRFTIAGILVLLISVFAMIETMIVR